MKDELCALGDLSNMKITKDLLKSVNTPSVRYVYILQTRYLFIPVII